MGRALHEDFAVARSFQKLDDTLGQNLNLDV